MIVRRGTVKKEIGLTANIARQNVGEQCRGTWLTGSLNGKLMECYK